jgi:hypothetical protein
MVEERVTDVHIGDLFMVLLMPIIIVAHMLIWGYLDVETLVYNFLADFLYNLCEELCYDLIPYWHVCLLFVIYKFLSVKQEEHQVTKVMESWCEESGWS